MSEKKHMIEKKLSELLELDEPSEEEVSKEALQKLPPRYEIRIQTQHDPVAEETKRYREIAREVDDRYDKYNQDEDKE